MSVFDQLSCQPLPPVPQLEKLKTDHEQELDSLQAELDTTSQQLATTQDQLNEAQITVQERQFMILSHRRAEHALAGHAQRLTAELTSCARDMAVLWTKLSEVVELQRGDRWDRLSIPVTWKLHTEICCCNPP